jgi:hypothetical protein
MQHNNFKPFDECLKLTGLPIHKFIKQIFDKEINVYVRSRSWHIDWFEECEDQIVMLDREHFRTGEFLCLSHHSLNIIETQGVCINPCFTKGEHIKGALAQGDFKYPINEQKAKITMDHLFIRNEDIASGKIDYKTSISTSEIDVCAEKFREELDDRIKRLDNPPDIGKLPTSQDNLFQAAKNFQPRLKHAEKETIIKSLNRAGIKCPQGRRKPDFQDVIKAGIMEKKGGC